MVAERQYENLDVEDGAEGEEVNPTDGVKEAALAAPCCCCCCCLFVLTAFFWIGASIFAAPEPRNGLGAVIWDPVLPANFTSLTEPLSTFWWKQSVRPGNYVDTAPVMGEWREGWHFFTLYFYYVVTSPTGEERTMIHAQSVWKWFGWEFRIWRGDTADGPVLTLSQDYWAQPWFSSDKVRIFDIYQDSLPIARATETVPWVWIGYGGSTVNVERVSTAEQPSYDINSSPPPMARMTQQPFFWIMYFLPSAWQVTNFVPEDIPSAVPGFYTLLSDWFESQESLGPVFWIMIMVVICCDFKPTKITTTNLPSA